MTDTAIIMGTHSFQLSGHAARLWHQTRVIPALSSNLLAGPDRLQVPPPMCSASVNEKPEG